MTAMEKWCQDHQATPLTTEMFFKNTDGTDACSKMVVEVGDADGKTKDVLELMWVPVRGQLYVSSPFRVA